MRLKISRSKNSASYYVTKTVYINGKEKTQTVEKLGTHAELLKEHDDPEAWAREYIKELNKLEKEQKREVIITRKQSKLITKDMQTSFNGGYLFLQDIYHKLGLQKICKDISSKYKFTFNLDSILSRLIYGRILFPSSKLNTLKLSKSLLEQPDFELQHIYRALEVIAKESDFIQSQLYKNSLNYSKRNDRILYYDCTNYFFEIEQEDGIKQYGPSKEHRPNPLVEMGLFMDGDGIPLAFSIHSGNTNEQKTLIPLEEQILNDFSLSKFVVCTDAGLSSNTNRKFNDCGERYFITTQSLKKLKKFLKDWALSSEDWFIPGINHSFNLDTVANNDELYNEYKDATFYKERWINENDIEQRLIVTFSFKYQNYQRTIRNRQIERAIKAVESNKSQLERHKQTDYKRFINKDSVTDDGEYANNSFYSINDDAIKEEEIYDGFYAVCTNLNDPTSSILKVNHRRWEIEESFRIMKSEFKSRPVYLSRDDRIKAHFTTCFLSLVIYRYLEKIVDNKFTCNELITTLKDMNFFAVDGEGYIPTYTRTDLTDALHEAFGFRTDYQITTTQQLKKIFKDTKKQKKVRKN